MFYNHLCGLILLTFFNPSLESLRDLKSASRLKQVQKKLGCRETSLGSLSEGLRVFDSERLVEIIQDLLGEIPNATGVDPRLAKLAHVPMAVDGSLLRDEALYAARTMRSGAKSSDGLSS